MTGRLVSVVNFEKRRSGLSIIKRGKEGGGKVVSPVKHDLQEVNKVRAGLRKRVDHPYSGEGLCFNGEGERRLCISELKNPKRKTREGH